MVEHWSSEVGGPFKFQTSLLPSKLDAMLKGLLGGGSPTETTFPTHLSPKRRGRGWHVPNAGGLEATFTPSNDGQEPSQVCYILLFFSS